jgi:hypothetical protein
MQLTSFYLFWVIKPNRFETDRANTGGGLLGYVTNGIMFKT